MKLLLTLIFFFSLLQADEEILYKGDTVKYFCTNNIVKAEIYFEDGTKDLVKVVWVNPKENDKTTLLSCEDFQLWIELTNQY